MKKVRFKALVALLMAIMLLVSSVPTYTFAASDTYDPLTVSGFNIDVVADTNNYSTLQSQGCLEGGHCYFSSAVSSSGYYPSGATISTSSGKKFKMRASTENNSLQLTSGNRTGTLTLATPGVYSKLAVLVTGGGGPTNATATVIYTDGTQSASTTITAYDWYSHHQSEVYGSLYRMRINISGFMRGSIDSGSYSGMYEGVISGLDTTKEVSAVRFNWTSGNYFNAFAVSGVIGANEHIHDKLSFKQWTSTNSLPTEAGSYVLTSDVTISSTWNVPSGKVNLCLNGYGIKMTDSKSAINVGSDSVFNLYECKTTSHKFSVNSNTSLATLDEENGSVTINGGYITGGNTSSAGGAMVVSGTFNMYGGNIIGNKGANGGAISTKANSTVNIKGGSIAYNYTGCAGGAFFCGKTSALNISGGTIHHNKASDFGGAIYMPESATCVVDISGGSITDNITARNGGAIHVSEGAALKLSGNPYVANNKTTSNAANNINFAAGAVATIKDKLDSTASIGVKSSSTTAAITSGLEGNATVSNFVADNADYEVYPNYDGEAVVGVFSHNHDDIDFAKWTSTNSLPTEPGNYCLLSNVTISSVWNVPQGEVNLCLNGKGITRTNASGTTGSVINVGSGAKLNLYDCGTNTRYYKVASPTVNGAGLGSIVSKSTYDSLSENERGTFKGGYITGGEITGNADNQHLIGGGVNVDGGAFTMNGGTIFGNKVCINAGAVKVKGAGASFTMNGGQLIANYNDCYGGAISVGDNNASRLCTVNINGGTIARNWSGRNAGALHVDGYGHTVNITGGNIVNNYTNGNYESAGRGGGAIMKDGANFSLSGNVVIKDNMRSGIADNIVFRNDSDTISLTSSLGEDADVGVYYRALSASSDKLVATNAQKDDLKHIHYDIPSEGSVVFCDGEKDWLYVDGKFIEISGTHHTHEANTIWASAITFTASVEKDGDNNVYTSLGDAFNNWTNGSTLKLLTDVTTSSTISVPAGEHTLDLNGCGIIMTGSSSAISVGSGRVLNIYDCGSAAHYITLNNYKFSSVSNSGTENISNGTGTVKVTGGYITGGKGDFGGGLRIGGGTVNMYGGTILGNYLYTNGNCGGGVWVGDNGTYNMNGGAIIYNYAQNNGGGMLVKHGTVTINDGLIAYNKNDWAGGGAIGVQYGTDTNVETTFRLYGGVIEKNITASTYGAIDVNTGKKMHFEIKGSPIVRNNVGSGKNITLRSDYQEQAFITVTGKLDESARLGITSNEGVVFTSGLKGNGTADNFISDDSAYSVVTFNGEALVGNYVATVEKGDDGNLYTNFNSAFDDWKANSGSTLKLYKDVDLTSSPEFFKDAGEWTLDLNGKTLKVKGIKFLSASGEEGSEKGHGAIINIDDTSADGGGKIDGNNTLTDENLFYVNNGGTLNLKKGTITNFNQSWGTILVKDNATVNIYDGFTISGNKSNTNGGGGAISVSTDGTLNMYGGVIENNTATGYKGGALRISGDTAEANIFGGTIQNNSASIGGGIAFTGGTLNIKGKVNISGNTGSNLYVANGKTINIVDALDDETSIGITLENDSGTFTNGLDGKGTASNFTADASGNEIRIVKKEGYCGPEHNHSWSYSADGDTITAVCSGVEEGICGIENQTIQVVAEGKTYDGSAVTATLTKSDGWTIDNTLATPEITYSGNTDAGTYTASIAIDEVTASTEFTIDEASMADEVSAQGCTVDYNGLSHSISVTSPTGSLVKYGTEEGTYNLLNNPTYTNAGTYVVYYQVTRKNYVTVTGSATVKINKINATVTITGNNSTVDYDGAAHTISGYVAAASTTLYNVNKDFTFSGNDSASRKDAGQTNMGLAAEQFTNTNENFETVTFNVTDGYQKVEPINAKVTIVGNNSTVDYDGENHTIEGYVATADTALYDVDHDFSFSGNASALQKNAGQTNMNLAAEQFANINSNFKEVTFIVTDGYQKVNQINATVNITGHNDTPDYDGEEHSVSGFDAVASTNLYDVDNDFTFSGTEEIKRTNAGTTYLELDSSQFENINPNFKTVTFIIDEDGYLTVNQIDATVVITGHNETVGYDDDAHTVTGYDAQSSTPLYDVENDFTFSGVDECERTDVGKTYMQLAADQFENINPNFRTITFEITDGYIEVIKVDAIITKKSERKSIVYNGSNQTLVTAGTVWGGTLQYALGKDDKTAPADKKFKEEIPSAKEIGNYYVWYRVEADSNHYSLDPVCIKVTIADKDWVTVSGTVYNDNGEPQSGADVTLTSGNKTVDTIVSDEDGNYYFTVPAGVYNIVTSTDGKSQTTKVELYEDKTQNIDMLSTKTESIVKVKSDNDLGVVVDGLNEEAEAIRKADKLTDSQSLSLVMTVEAKTAETAKNANKFKDLSKNTTFEYFDISLEKTVDSKKTVLNSSQTVLEIAVPYEKMNRKDIAAYYCDGNEVKKLTESKSKEAGTYWIDKENKMIYIYSNEFATFAIGYTPYYLVDSSLALGSFKGKATVVMKGKNGEGTYTLKDVSPDKLSFDNIPKGEYEMTVTWVDGATNTLTVDVTVA